jgi:carotenoid cleavage dioxygenase-like enzyme
MSWSTDHTESRPAFACASCCGPIADSLRRLGSIRCHDCIEQQAPVRESCVVDLDERRSAPRELDHRESDGIAVTLLWHEDSNRVVVRVVDSRTEEEFELEVAPRDALDAFYHPNAYMLFAAA